MARFVLLDRAVYSRPGLRNHCTVTALAVACDMDFDAAHALCERRGRRRNRGWHAGNAFFRGRKKVKVNGAALVGVDHPYPPITIATFLDRNRTGRFIISTNGHAMAVVDGALHDFRQRREGTKLTQIIRLKVPRRCRKAVPQDEHTPPTGR